MLWARYMALIGCRHRPVGASNHISLFHFPIIPSSDEQQQTRLFGVPPLSKSHPNPASCSPRLGRRKNKKLFNKQTSQHCMMASPNRTSQLFGLQLPQQQAVRPSRPTRDSSQFCFGNFFWCCCLLLPCCETLRARDLVEPDIESELTTREDYATCIQICCLSEGLLQVSSITDHHRRPAGRRMVSWAGGMDTYSRVG
jgi:hypothetical protein